jgi:isopenicillin-N N-acyltransferase-like protein
VAGPPRQRGRAYGEQARDRVHRSIAGYQEAFGHYAGWDWRRVRAEAKRFEAPIAGLYPQYLDELRGIAEGAGAGFEDVLALNVRTEIMFAGKARAARSQRTRLPGECTAFAALPHVCASGHTLVGQNWDWLPHCFGTLVVLEAEQPEAPDFVTVVEAGLLAKAGMNSAGLAVATNALVTEADRGEPGLPYHVLLRALYDCETVTDALVVLQRGTRSSSANYLLGHADGTALDIEAAPGDFTRLSVLTPERSGVLLHTNHFLSAPAGTADLSLWAMPDSAVRHGRISALLATAGPPWSPQGLQRALADHAGFPSGICCHPDPREHPLERGATVASLVMDAAERRIWLSDGNPCTAAYRCLDYATFLAKDTRAAKEASAAPAPGPSHSPH